MSLAVKQEPQALCLSLASLTLNYFRNYDYARLELSPAPVVLTGRNGMGKTNILEAISLLSPGRGLRRAKLAELDNQRAAGMSWAVAATVHGRQGEVKIGTGRDPEISEQSPQNATDRRLVKVDGKLTGQSELASHVSIAWLTPQMEQLFHESASAGRKFLDRLVYAFDAGHGARVGAYEHAMRERNKLLAQGRADPIWLDSLEQTMAEAASGIASARLYAAEQIGQMIASSPLSFPKASLAVEGAVENRLKEGAAALEAEQHFKAELYEGRGRDAAAGRTLVGPHRSELAVTHLEKAMRAEFCSTGEQKALMLSIVLAQARVGAAFHGVVPLLLLDEVVAHLDATRRLELFEEICQIGAQTWMTGTDDSLFDGLQEKAQFLKVDNGQVSASVGFIN